MRYLILLLVVGVASLHAQIPNAGFEDWEVIEELEEPVDWITNNRSCCIAVEKVGGDEAISGSYSMKLSSTAFSIEGTLPGHARAIVPGPLEGYNYLRAKVHIDSVDMGRAVMEVWGYTGDSIAAFGNWELASETDGVIEIEVPNELPGALFDSLQIRLFAVNFQTGAGSIGFCSFTIDDLELSVVSTARASSFEKPEVWLFPNPAPSVFTIRLPAQVDEAVLQLFSPQGQKLYEQMVQAGDNQVRLAGIINMEHLVLVKIQRPNGRLLHAQWAALY